MVDVLNLQGDGPDQPGEQKRSNSSWLACGGDNQSNRSRIFC